MFSILVKQYFDERLIDSDEIGYFNTWKDAHCYLIDKGFEHEVIIDEWIDGSVESDSYELISEDAMTEFIAEIVEIEGMDTTG